MLRAGPVLLIALFTPTVLVGQSFILTEEAFLAAVTDTHPAVTALAGESDLAAAELLRATLLPNPTLEGSLEAPDGAARETALGVTWTPPLDRRRALRREAAASGLAAAESRIAASRRRLRLELRRAYATWAFATERRDLLAAHLVQVSELAKRARARAEAGETPGLVARRFTLEEAQARAELARAEARVSTARAEISAWYPALPADARPVLPALPPAPGEMPDLARRPDLLAREREVERAEALRRLSRSLYEAPALGLGWKRIEDRGVEASGPVISAGWTVPLFDRRQADRREAEARLATARADLALARVRAEAERAGALVAYERLRAEAQEADRAAGETGPLLAGAAASYQLGESGLTDFLDTLRAAAAARTNALEMRESAWAAQRDLEAALGRPLTGDLP